MIAAEHRGEGFVQQSIACAILLLCAFGSSAHALVPCSEANSLCVGNPCVTKPVEVASPCELDFGDRTLVIGGTLKVPNGGHLSLKAGTIIVRRAIIGRHTKLPFDGDGSTIELTAKQNIVVEWRIVASGRTEPGSIALVAGGNILLYAPVRAAAQGPGPTAPGGAIVMEAGGEIAAIRRARIRAEGAMQTDGGTVQLSGARGVRLLNRISVDGQNGGAVTVSSLNGNVSIVDDITASGEAGAGGDVAVVALRGAITVQDDIQADGTNSGGSVVLMGSSAVTTFGPLRASSNDGPGGTIFLASNADVVNHEALYADGEGGGHVSLVSSFGTVRTQAPVLAEGKSGTGGSIGVSGADGVFVDSMLNADGGRHGGDIGVSGFEVHLSNRGDLFARGDTGGTVNLNGSVVIVEAGAKILVNGRQPGGAISLAADGDLTLSGEFSADGRTGGRIEAAAAGHLLADGEFSAGGGCIAFNGEAVDTRGGSFDVPVVARCR
jgi:hypothetical protein